MKNLALLLTGAVLGYFAVLAFDKWSNPPEDDEDDDDAS